MFLRYYCDACQSKALRDSVNEPIIGSATLGAHGEILVRLSVRIEVYGGRLCSGCIDDAIERVLRADREGKDPHTTVVLPEGAGDGGCNSVDADS